MKENLSPGSTHHWFPPLGSTNNDVFFYIFAFCDLSLLSTFLWRRPQKAAENLVLMFFRSVFKPFFLEPKDFRCFYFLTLFWSKIKIPPKKLQVNVNYLFQCLLYMFSVYCICCLSNETKQEFRFSLVMHSQNSTFNYKLYMLLYILVTCYWEWKVHLLSNWCLKFMSR